MGNGWTVLWAIRSLLFQTLVALLPFAYFRCFSSHWLPVGEENNMMSAFQLLNYPAAANPATTSGCHSERKWRRFADRDR